MNNVGERLLRLSIMLAASALLVQWACQLLRPALLPLLVVTGLVVGVRYGLNRYRQW